MRGFLGALALLGMVLGSAGRALAASAVPVALLHTNDLHSHFRGERTPLGLGGVARLVTAIRKARASAANSLLIDGGDWSEGNIYFTQGAGAETLKMMEHMGYDVAVVGNHDWFNGPDTLLDILSGTAPDVAMLAANVDVDGYSRADEFRQKIQPYVIKQVGGVKIAFIGLLTYEFVYDHYFKPVKITGPFSLTRDLAAQLKKQADAVVVISHNAIGLNQALLKMAPDVDLVIGAHDHVKLTQPVVVQRPGRPDAWVVEAGCWGRYLGRVDLQVTPRDPADAGSRGSVELVRYGLTQMDASVAEDRETAAMVDHLDAVIEGRDGHIMHDHVADSSVELDRGETENPMGDLATDAYRQAVQADLSIDQVALIYGEIHEGAIRTVDVFNSNPGVWNAATGKSWTLHTLPISGKTLKWVLNLMYSTRAASLGALSASGLHVVYNPLVRGGGNRLLAGIPQPRPLASELISELGLEIGRLDDVSAQGIVLRAVDVAGEPLDESRNYKVAVPGGIVEALEFLDSLFPNAVSLDQLQDTGLEDWRVMADYLHAHSPFTREQLPMGRIQSEQPDLGVLYDDIEWTPIRPTSRGTLGQARVRVTNYGATTSPATGPVLHLSVNSNGVNYAVDPQWVDLGDDQGILPLGPGESREYVWNQVTVPSQLGLAAVTARLTGTDAEVNHSNDLATRFFAASHR